MIRVLYNVLKLSLPTLNIQNIGFLSVSWSKNIYFNFSNKHIYIYIERERERDLERKNMKYQEKEK